MLSIAGAVNATVLTFDDIGAIANIGTVPDGYGGLDWDNMAYKNRNASLGTGYDNGTVSGDYVAFNYYANVATVSNGLFDFNGAYLTAAWNTGLSIEIVGLVNGVQAYIQTVIVDTTGPTWFDFNFLGVDSLSFSSFGGTDANSNDNGAGVHFAMDNFTFNEVSTVPVPAAVWLFGSGLVGLIGFGRRKMAAA